MADSNKRKKKADARNGSDDVKKKRKVEIGGEPTNKSLMRSPKKSGVKAADHDSMSPKPANPKGQERNETERQHEKKPSKATFKQKGAMKADGGKTMDYKKFHLKMMKERWKNAKVKRHRKNKQNKKAEMKKQAPSKSEKSYVSKAPKEKDFGICDFSELLYHWSDFAVSNLTAVEREELLLAPRFVFSNKNSRSAHRFFSKRIPDWKEWMQRKISNGSPHIIIICPSDVRAVALNRDIAEFKGAGCRTLKLIPKEKKKEHAKQLETSTVHLAIGTPHRIESLITLGSLKLDECRVIALDWSFKDTKQRRLITIPELRVDVMRLFRKHFIPLFKDREEVALFLF